MTHISNMNIPKQFKQFEKLGLSKFTGRDILPEDKPAFERIAAAFAPAKDQSGMVWKNWTDWQNCKKNRDNK